MGLIKAFSGEISNALSSQWRDCYECNGFQASELLVKGQRATDRFRISTRSIGADNRLLSGSKIVVKEGQCAVIVCDGNISDVCAETGGYTYDVSSEPSIFLGDLDSGVLSSFKESKILFNYGGLKEKERQIYFINIEELHNNSFSTEQPICFYAHYPELYGDFCVRLNCKGFYSYRIVNPIEFFKYCNCNNNQKNNVGESIRSETRIDILNALNAAFTRLSALGVRCEEIKPHGRVITSSIYKDVEPLWIYKYGVFMMSISIDDIFIEESDLKKIIEAKEIFENCDINIATQKIIKTQEQIIQSYSSVKSPDENAEIKLQDWTCTCGKTNNRKFCMDCGKPRPVLKWTCECGTVNERNFCTECGKPRKR